MEVALGIAIRNFITINEMCGSHRLDRSFCPLLGLVLNIAPQVLLFLDLGPNLCMHTPSSQWSCILSKIHLCVIWWFKSGLRLTLMGKFIIILFIRACHRIVRQRFRRVDCLCILLL